MVRGAMAVGWAVPAGQRRPWAPARLRLTLADAERQVWVRPSELQGAAGAQAHCEARRASVARARSFASCTA